MSYLNIRQAAEHLGYSHHTVQKYVERGLLLPDIKIGRSVGFKTATLDRFKATRGPRGRRSRRMTDADWAEAKRRFHAGETLASVAGAYQVSAGYLLRKVGARGKVNGSDDR